MLQTKHWSYGKNKLEDALIQNLKEFNRYTFETKDLPRVKSSIENIIASLNSQYNRCSDLEYTWQSNRPGGTVSFKIKDYRYDDWMLFIGGYNSPALKIFIGKENKDL